MRGEYFFNIYYDFFVFYFIFDTLNKVFLNVCNTQKKTLV